MSFLLNITGTCVKLAHRSFVHHKMSNLMRYIESDSFRGLVRINRYIRLPSKYKTKRINFLTH